MAIDSQAVPIGCLLCIALAGAALYAQAHARLPIEVSWDDLLGQLAPVRLTVESFTVFRSRPSPGSASEDNQRVLESLVRMRLNAEILSVLLEESTDRALPIGYKDLCRTWLQYLQFKRAAQLAHFMTLYYPPGAVVDGSIRSATQTYWRMVHGLVAFHKGGNPVRFKALAMALCCDEVLE